MSDVPFFNATKGQGIHAIVGLGTEVTGQVHDVSDTAVVIKTGSQRGKPIHVKVRLSAILLYSVWDIEEDDD